MSDDDLVNSFTERLHYFENGGNIDELLALFSENAELGHLTRSQPLHGQPGVKEFWSGYRSAFGKVRSTFSRALKGANHVVNVLRLGGFLVARRRNAKRQPAVDDSSIGE